MRAFQPRPSSITAAILLSAILLSAIAIFPVIWISIGTAETVSTPPGTPSAAPVEESFLYKKVEHQGEPRELRIDWTRPADWTKEDSRGAVVFFHGGGWTGGQPGQFAEHSKELANLGVVCFRTEYRLLDRKTKVLPDDCIADASDALRFVRKNASRFGIDPNRIAAGGGSAGGHLAAFLGMMDDSLVDGRASKDTSRKPNALLLFNPVYDNGPGGWGTARVGDRFAEYSPLHNITADDPPSIVFLGEKDSLIPVATAERFQNLSREVGVPSELRTYAGQPHGFFNVKVEQGKYYRDTLAESIQFLKTLNWFD